MAYRPVTDDDHGWAMQGDAEQRFRGPCGPLIALVNTTVSWVQDQSGIQKAAMILGVVTFFGLVNTFIEDEQMSVLVPGDGTCANKARFVPSDRQCKESPPDSLHSRTCWKSPPAAASLPTSTLLPFSVASHGCGTCSVTSSSNPFDVDRAR